ncbi:MAG: hypothetical protein ABI919_15425 [Ramlibacter sp.]
MTLRSYPQPRVALVGLALAAGLGVARAQSSAAPTDSTPLVFRSALENYQPYTEEKPVDWKEANDLTARIGGWRAYAKEAQQAAPPDAAGGMPAPDPHAGHGGHGGHAMPPKDKP